MVVKAAELVKTVDASGKLPAKLCHASPKIACLKFSLQKAKMHLGISVVVEDPTKLEAIRREKMDIVKRRIDKILKAGANVVLTTGGIDDLCLKQFTEAGAMAVRRCKKVDLKRISKATGANFVSSLANLERDGSFESSMLVPLRLSCGINVVTAGEALLALTDTRNSEHSIRTQNVTAACAIANIVKSSLGPVGLDKMLVDDVGDVIITNGGATILKQLEVEHPAGKVLVELVQLQDNLAIPTEELGHESIIGSNAEFFSDMVVKAAELEETVDASGKVIYPINAVNVLKAHGKSASESMLIEGYALNCTLASEAMPRKSQDRLSRDPTKLEAIRREKMDIVKRRIDKILKAGANVVRTTGGIDDLCFKLFTEVGAMAVRRCKKVDLKRIAKATGATGRLALAVPLRLSCAVPTTLCSMRWNALFTMLCASAAVFSKAEMSFAVVVPAMRNHLSQFTAACAIANIVKSSLGPVGLDKMLVDDVGDVIITNDGATILKQLEVEHPAGKVLVELAQLQDEEVGDGTTSVVIVAAELLKAADQLVKAKLHPTTVINGYRLACKEAIRRAHIDVIQDHRIECRIFLMLGTCEEILQERISDVELITIKKTGARSAASIILRGANDVMLDEMERSVHDALCVCRRVLESRNVVCGGGPSKPPSTSTLKHSLLACREQLPMAAFADALLVIPKTLARNAAKDSGKRGKLRSFHSLVSEEPKYKFAGLDLIKGTVGDRKSAGVLEPLISKVKSLKFATEAAITILRIDDLIKLDKVEPRGGGECH
ncbi:hypothetical protein QR680_000393 [Steinernema hermaphroditum]|uniref:T-complex protein 1 subunit alpha n=1 Tax=Steinernema hermaphroditum TaxID=289476 RepID=A0AA39GV67_9BILA|nr:hypothetical protein QR680_000393 [Steinernema hermaphroditum]